ncbi:hypothetical protein ACVWYG_001166 [Pedobacter sp. UYEF25]
MENFIFEGIVNLPLAQIDLRQWLMELTENDYKSFSKAHKAIGITKIDGVESMINIESIGGNLLIQHYKIQETGRQHLSLYSAKSEAYLFHLVKVNVSVRWKMKIQEQTEKSTLFKCEIGVIYPSRLLKIASMLVAGNYFLQKHIDEEGPLFAKHIETKFKD